MAFLNTWVAIGYGVILAAMAMIIPAGLLSVALWVIGIKKVKNQSEEATIQ